MSLADIAEMASIVRLIARGALAVVSITMANSIACAQTNAPNGRHVEASIIAETRSIVPGQPLHLALRQEIQPGWHTYWSNPGDSGLPTTIDLTLPPGFKPGPIAWPTPQRFTSGPVVDYGYEREVILPVTIETPATLQVGVDISLKAHASWLVCSDTCIPEDAELTMSLPVRAVTATDPQWVDSFAASRARTPMPNPFPTKLSVTDDKLKLHVAMGDASQLRDVMFFPEDANVVDNDSPQVISRGPDGLNVTLVRDTSKPTPSILNGVLAYRDIAAQAGGSPGAIAIAAPIEAVATSAHAGLELVGAILLAFAGGIVLNLMPCVLPVLAIKAFGLVQHGQASQREIRLQGLAYAAGVLISFALIAGTLIGFRAAGAEIGWGFQLQSPLFVAVMIYVLFAVGLNLSGAFAFGASLTGVGSDLSSLKGYAGSFFTGALATLVATPCTAPFMAAALGFAITQPWYASLAVFESVGFGLAFPYLLISFSPGARNLLPKPGIWMVRLKECLAFPVYGTAVWLIYVLSLESGAETAAAILAGIVLIAFTVWVYEVVRSSGGRSRGWGTGVAALSAVCAFALLLLATSKESAPRAADDAGLDWQDFSQASLDALRAEGKPIFVDVTAAWCITCKVNERVALADPSVRKKFSAEGVIPIKADWTREDPAITRMLEANGRAGVPLYLFYPKSRTSGERRPVVIFPQILTADAILEAISTE
jgi:thiol:disulfide interchange protein/DsbC/DsbD-like thiol-disulfide interchange protein